MNIARSFIVLILLCCSGCGTITFGYNHADWVLNYWINDYTSFNAEQRAQIRIEIDNYLLWHRRHALPEYITYLQDMDAAINQEASLSVGDVMRLRKEGRRLYQLTLEPMIRPAAHVLSTLDDEQITELADTLAKRNQKQRKKMLKGSARDMLAARAERHVEFVENLVGRLSTDQENKITEMSLRIPFASGDFIGQREARQAELIALLRDKAGEDRIAALLLRWLKDPDAYGTPQQQQAITAYEDAMNEMTIRLVALLTTRQRQYLTDEIATYIDGFRKLGSKLETTSVK